MLRTHEESPMMSPRRHVEHKLRSQIHGWQRHYCLTLSIKLCRYMQVVYRWFIRIIIASLCY